MNNLMYALVKKTPTKGLVLERLPIPTINEDEVLIKVLQSAICGTDLHIYNWDDWAKQAIETPRILGHEFVGKVVAYGSRVNLIEKGDIVSAEGHIVCASCRNCREGKRHICSCSKSIGISCDGAFAEYIAVPSSSIWKHSESISLDIATIFDPLGNATHACQQFNLLGEDVLISGAGALGLLATTVARYCGARSVTVTDVNSKRLQLAKKLGASNTVNIVNNRPIGDLTKELDIADGFGVGLEMSGNASAIATMVEQMRYGGSIAMLGIPIEQVNLNWNKVLFRMIRIQGVSGRRIFETWRLMSVMIERGLDLNSIVSLKLPFEKFKYGFEYLLDGNPGKVILQWS